MLRLKPVVVVDPSTSSASAPARILRALRLDSYTDDDRTADAWVPLLATQPTMVAIIEIIEAALHAISSFLVVLVYSIFVMTDRMRPVMTEPGSLTSTMTLALILALGTNITYFVGRVTKAEICPERLLAAAVTLTTLLFFATVDCWNAVRYQEHIGEHNKDTKKSVGAPNDRANTVAAGIFIELLISLAMLAVLVKTKFAAAVEPKPEPVKEQECTSL